MHKVDEEVDFRLVCLIFLLGLVLFHPPLVLPLDAAVPLPSHGVGQQQPQQQVEVAGHGAAPPRRGYYHVQAGGFGVPLAVVVRALDVKVVFARRKVVVRGRVLCRFRYPFLVDSFQHVRVAVLLRVFVAQRGKADGQTVVLEWENHSARHVHGLVQLQYFLHVPVVRLVGQVDVRDVDRREVFVVAEQVGREYIESVDSAEIELPVGCLQRRLHGELVSL